MEILLHLALKKENPWFCHTFFTQMSNTVIISLIFLINLPDKMFNKEDDTGLVWILRKLWEEVEITPWPDGCDTHISNLSKMLGYVRICHQFNTINICAYRSWGGGGLNIVHASEYWMIYRGPGFLADVWFGFSPRPHKSASCLSFLVFLRFGGGGGGQKKMTPRKTG